MKNRRAFYMRKLVRKVKKINGKVLFASLLIAVIAVTGGVALMGGKDTVAEKTETVDIIGGTAYIVWTPSSYNGVPQGACSFADNSSRSYAKLSGCKVTANNTNTARTIKVRMKPTAGYGDSVLYTIRIKPNIVNLTMKVGEEKNLAQYLREQGIFTNIMMDDCGSNQLSKTGVLVATSESVCTYKAQAPGTVQVSLNQLGSDKPGIVNVTVSGSTVGSTTSTRKYAVYNLYNPYNTEVTITGGCHSSGTIKSNKSGYCSVVVGKEVTFPTAERAGKNFLGWAEGNSTNACSGKIVSKDLGNTEGSKTFVPCFTSSSYNPSSGGSSATTYTVQFDANATDAKLTCYTAVGQKAQKVNGIDLCVKSGITAGTRISNPLSATREGYVLVGWKVNGGSVHTSDKLTVNENMYLTAEWAPVSSAPMGCTSSTGQTSSTGFGTITHCIPTVCSNGVIRKDNIPNLSSVTCASGYTKDESQVALISTASDAGSCSQQVGSSCNWSGKGTCYDKYSYACVLKASLSVKQKTVALQQGQSADLKSYISYSGVDSSNIEFVSSNPNVATVDRTGRVTARKSGRATIYVQIGSVRDSIDVVVGEAGYACENSHTEPITAYEGDEGIVTHCLNGTCSQYGGYTFQTTAPSDFVINCVTGQKKVELIYSSCEQLEGVCSPNDKVNCTQRWYWQCVPDTSRREYHTVTYIYGNDAGDVQDVKVADGALAPNIHPYRNNYTFLGWYYTAKSTNSAYLVDLESSVITEDMTLYAHWKFNGSNNSDSEDQLNVSGKDAPTCTLSVNTKDWAPKKTLGVTVNKGKYELADLPFNYTFNSGSMKGQTSYTANTSIEIDKNGKYAVTVKDVRGNTATCSYTENRIDNEKPAITTFGYHEGSMEISITSTDAQSGIKGYYYSQLSTFPTADSAGWQTSPTMKVTEIAHYFGWVMDNAGNISERVKIEAGHNISAPDATMTTFNIDAEGLVDKTSTVAGAALENQRKASYKVMQLSKPADLMAFNFNPLKTFYEVSVTSGKISFYATLPKGSSFVEGYEPKENYPLEYGLNTVLIKVKDSHGIVRTYTVLVTRVDNRSGVNLLSNLSVSEGSIEFTPYQTEYTVKVGKNVDRVSINASLASATSSFVEGYGPREVTLEDGQIDAQIKVRSASGTERAYTIHIYRNMDVPDQSGPNKSGSTYLSSLSVVGANLVFDKETLHYNVSVGYDVHSVTVYAFAEDKAASVKINGGGSLRVGENTVTVSVTGTNGRTRTYTIVVIRKEDELGLSSNTELSTLSIGGYDIKFRPDKTNYELKVDREKTLVIMATPKSDRSNVYIVGNEDLSTFSTLKISVVAEDGTTDVYSIDISKDAWNTRVEVIIAVIGLTIAVGATVVIQIRRKQKRKALNID